ncbi:hypothetical protein AHF37_07670 [Paragonimus kellicotti]|nr:hypothetical protein AHF37_07670 [Paragonimus kellicotti]
MSLEYARVGNIEDITSIGSTTSFLQATAADVRLTRVNWQSYVQGQIINTEQFNFITRLDNASTPEARDRVIHEDRQLTARVFVFILNRISKEQTLQYILTLLDDILQEDKMRVEIFQDYFKDSKDALWSQFFTFLQRGDAFCTYQASRIIAKFACWSSQLMEEKELMHYLNWLRDQLKMPTNHYDQTVARNLQMMLRIKQYRARFAGVGGIDTIVEVLADKFTSRQLQYQLIFCLWCMSFDTDHVALMYKNRALIPTVSDVLREADREKITRISLALFRTNHYDQTVARNLQMMLRIKQYRARFAGVGGIDTIVEVLADKFTSRQLQYQLIFCLWCMSFDTDHVALMYKNRALIPTVSDVLREADREKITRISLALFRSILEKLPTPADQRACGLCLVQCKVLRQLELLSQKDFSHDPELTEDMTYLTVRFDRLLLTCVMQLLTFDIFGTHPSR